MNLPARLAALERVAPMTEPLVVLVHLVSPEAPNREAETATVGGAVIDRWPGETEADYLDRLGDEARQRGEMRVIVNGCDRLQSRCG